MAGKNRRHGSPIPVGVSIRPTAAQRPSGGGHRERSATNANRSLSAKAQASVADDLGPGVLDCPPEAVVRLAPPLALCPGRHCCTLAARTVPQILGQTVEAAASASWSPPHCRRTPPIDRANGRRQSAVARTPGFMANSKCSVSPFPSALSRASCARSTARRTRPGGPSYTITSAKWYPPISSPYRPSR